MKHSDLKVGMKVKVRDSLFARMGENMAINVFIVGECHNEYFFSLKAYGNDNNFMAHCADFEPYEEPKEEPTTYQVKDLEGNVIEEKVVEDKQELPKPTIEKLDDGGYVIDLDKLDKGTYTPKELLDIIYEVINASDNLPITQEFIESFGFVEYDDISGVFFKKNETVNLRFDYIGGVAMLFDFVYNDWIFDKYTCTTQSELRFLLTKGRIDCSK